MQKILQIPWIRHLRLMEIVNKLDYNLDLVEIRVRNTVARIVRRRMARL